MQTLPNLLTKKLFLAALLLLIPALAVASPKLFTISNSSSGPLGSVTLHYAGGSSIINVTSSGNWVTNVPGTVTAITLYGQTCTGPLQSIVQLPSGNSVRVVWRSTGYIEIIDIQVGA